MRPMGCEIFHTKLLHKCYSSGWQLTLLVTSVVATG